MLNRHESVVDPFFEQIDHYKIYKKHEFSIHFLILQHFSFSATFIWPQLESNYWTYIHELKKLGNSFTSELLIRNGNKTLCFLKAKLAFINLFLCMLKLEPRKVPIFYYITVTSKSAILWTKEHFIIHYKPRCMLFRFVLLFLGPKSGTKRGLTVNVNCEQPQTLTSSPCHEHMPSVWTTTMAWTTLSSLTTVETWVMPSA